MNGIINIYKEKDYTSHDVVAKLRGILHQKRIGHTGTLDPKAEGVLPICLGIATRLCEMLADHTKTYRAGLLLGKTTDTEDVWGEVLTEQEVSLTEEAVREAVFSFIGEYHQIPPMYSAKKVDGKKLYELAREGKIIPRKAALVTIFAIEIEEIKLPHVSFTVYCSKGTYIRSLCRDIGETLHVGGCMDALTRTQVGDFLIENALTLSQVEKLRDEGCIEEAILSVEEVLAAHKPIIVSEEYEKLIINGNPFYGYQITDSSLFADGERVRVYGETIGFVGLYEWRIDTSMFWPIKMFLSL